MYLQNVEYLTPELAVFREELVADMVRKVRELSRDSFAVKQHLRYVERFAEPENYKALTYGDTQTMAEELCPLLIPDEDAASAVRFDALLYGTGLAQLIGKNIPAPAASSSKKSRRWQAWRTSRRSLQTFRCGQESERS